MSGVKHSDHYDEDFYVEEVGNFSHKLGGNMSDQLATARASSVAAAYRRLSNPSTNGLGTSGVHEEPDPDDSAFLTHEEQGHMDSVEKKKSSIANSDEVPFSTYQEPDPDDSSDYQIFFEPDPDDSQGNETLVSECSHLEIPGSRTMSEPPYIVTRGTQLVSMTNSKLEAMKSCEETKPFHSEQMEILNSKVQAEENVAEPDPDDLEMKDNLGHGKSMRPENDSAISRITKDQFHPSKDYKNPGFDESQSNGIMQEPDPDDNLLNPQEISIMQIDEPDPDDQELQRIQDPVTVICSRMQKAIEVLQAEVKSKQATVILQTLFKIIRYCT